MLLSLHLACRLAFGHSAGMLPLPTLQDRHGNVHIVVESVDFIASQARAWVLLLFTRLEKSQSWQSAYSRKIKQNIVSLRIFP